MTAAITRTISAPCDRKGNRADTGYHAGERVRVRQPSGGGREGVVIGPAPQPYEYMSNASHQWRREICAAPALKVRLDGDALAASIPAAWLVRVEDAALAEAQEPACSTDERELAQHPDLVTANWAVPS